MHLLLLGLVGLHFWTNRRTKTLLLPSHLLCFLDVILQMVIPILIINKTRTHEYYPLASSIVIAGLSSFIISYQITKILLPTNKLSLQLKLEKYLNKFDPFLKKGNFFVFWLGVSLVLLVFAKMRLIPIFGNTEFADPRFFYNNPLYFKYYKNIYWLGISLISASLLNLFIFFQIFNKKRNLSSLFVFFLGFMVIVFTRHRAPIFVLCMAMYVFYYQLNPRRLSPLNALVHVVSVFFLAMLALFLREGSGYFIDWIITALQHGSSFVDFHEFAESLGHFGDQGFLMGKTYLGDLLGFLPQGTLDFRDHYRWKEWTKILFDVPPTAGGYRLTLFGESYFNFGFIGVIIQGLLLGIGYRYLDLMILLLQKSYQEDRKFSLSGYFLISSIANCIILSIANFYNILFTASIFVGCLIIFFVSLVFRDVAIKKYDVSPTPFRELD